ncbi:MAG: cell wall hydrolase [Clostridiales bacterium]|nr:cell wall hydrolase [Clostridiales bacterium]
MKRCFLYLLLALLTFFCGCAFPPALDLVYLPVFEVVVDSPPPTPPPTPLPLPTPDHTPEPSPEPAAVPALHTYANAVRVTETDLNLAARVAYWEMRGKGEYAYRAVLSVIYNRCMATNWGDGVTSIPEVVYHPGQFSVVNKKPFRTTEPPAEIIEYARDIFCNGNISIPYNVMFFGWSGLISKKWGGRRMYKEIGGDYFFYGPTGDYRPPEKPKP